MAQAQTCTTPTLTLPANTNVCYQKSATITATTNGSVVKWYDSSTATVPVFTGNPFTTPNLTANTNYWAEAISYGTGTQVTGGKNAPSGSSSSAVVTTTAPWGLAFTANADFILDSADVFTTASGTLVVQLLDSNYAILQEKTFSLTAGTSSPTQITLALGFVLQNGVSYKLVARSSPSMIRDSTGNSFPYTLGTLATITGGTINNSNTNSTSYYFFFNWKGSPLSTPCVSPRSQTIVTVSSQVPPPVAASPQTLPAGSTLANIVVTGQSLTWYSSATSTTSLPSSTVIVNGTTYYVSQTVGGCESSRIPVTVNTVLAITEAEYKKNFKIYPNPVHDVLTIETKERIKEINIFDSAGNLVNTFQSDEQNNKLDLKNLMAGKYFVVIKSYDSDVVLKIPILKQ